MVFAAQNCGLNDGAPPRSDLYTGWSEGRRRFQGRIGRRRGTKGKEKDELGGGSAGGRASTTLTRVSEAS